MNERKSNECGNKSQTRTSRGSQPPRGYRPRDNTLYSSHRRRNTIIGKPNSQQANFKWDDAVAALGEELNKAGI